MGNNLETIKELADRLKVQPSWIYSRTRETGPGALPRIKLGKYLRFNPEAVDEWIVKQNEK
jgi:excisionase family DNA binding protein